MESRPRIEVVCGQELLPWLDAVARLRIEVFADWPYLYAGGMDYERDYLAAYARSPRSVFVLAMDDAQVVGASTGIPLSDETPAFQRPFQRAGIDVASVFYFGESVLRREFRGLGLGHAFFDGREAHARRLGGFACTAFCAVDREPGDPRRPAEYRGNEAFWSRRGYRRQNGITVHLPWDEPGQGEVIHALTCWLRDLEQAS
jgi:GNAT superfamily N-acetyltransferase